MCSHLPEIETSPTVEGTQPGENETCRVPEQGRARGADGLANESLPSNALGGTEKRNRRPQRSAGSLHSKLAQFWLRSRSAQKSCEPKSAAWTEPAAPARTDRATSADTIVFMIILQRLMVFLTYQASRRGS